jgi:hypothetical protein
VFLLTPQHAVKAHETTRLLSLSPQQLMRESPEIRYVLARHSTRLFLGQDGKEGPVLESLREKLPALERALLGPASSLPPQYRIRAEALTPGGQTYARVLEIVRSP